jgi:hypothetical protein
MKKSEASRYLENAKELLCKSPIENNRYSDVKYVKSAFGVAYLGLLKAIDEYLLKKGISPKKLPKKEEEYKKALQKYASIYNGKLLKEFNKLYDELNIAGYYRGLLTDTVIVKEILKRTKAFIEMVK